MFKKMTGLSLMCIGLVTAISLLQACYSSSVSQADDKSRSIDSKINSHVSHAQKATTKPGASVSIRNTQPIVLNSVGLHDIELVLHSPSYPGSISVSATASKGMGIVSTAAPVLFPLTEKGEYRLPMSVNIEQEGRHYIRLNVGVTSNDITEKRVISAIVQVGSVHPKLQKTAPVADSDEVISLPAQEQVSPQH